MPTPFNCLIEATAGNDTTYYFATVEDDGFTYFNDSQFFRVQTPDNIHDLETEGQTITITTGLQLWYVVRDVWVFSNLFDSLTLQMIHGSDIDKADLQTGLNTIIGYINNLGQTSIGTNGDTLYNLIMWLQSLTQELNNQGITTPSMPSYSVFNSWTDRQNYILQ